MANDKQRFLNWIEDTIQVHTEISDQVWDSDVTPETRDLHRLNGTYCDLISDLKSIHQRLEEQND